MTSAPAPENGRLQIIRDFWLTATPVGEAAWYGNLPQPTVQKYYDRLDELNAYALAQSHCPAHGEYQR